MKYTRYILLALMLALPALAQDTIRVVSYNLLVFDGEPNSAGRMPYFKHVLENLVPDLLVCVEIDNQKSVDMFCSQVLDSSVYASAQFIDGYDHDGILFYKKSMFEVPNVRFIRTSLRNFYMYKVKYLHNENAGFFYLVAAHLTASDGADKRAARADEVSKLLKVINDEYAGEPVLLCGDLNLYNSREPAWTALIADSVFFDPVSASGTWHDGASFAK